VSQTNMESELDQYLHNIGLSTSMLKSVSLEQTDDDTQPTSATVSNCDSDKAEDNDDGIEACQVGEPVVGVTVADSGLVTSREVPGSDDDQGDVKASEVDPTFTASLTDDSCCTAADNSLTQANCDCETRSEDTVQNVALLSPSSSDNANQTSASPLQFPADNSSVQSSQQQMVTVNGNVAQLDCSEERERVTSQSGSTRSAVVFSTVPRHVDAASALSNLHVAHPQNSSSSCTIMLNGSAADVVSSLPTTHRAAGDGQERSQTVWREQKPQAQTENVALAKRGAGDGHERSQVEVVAPAKRSSPDAMSYTSTIIRCSTSSVPVIATKSRDKDAPAVDDIETPLSAQSQVKTTRNYVSVVQIGPEMSGSSAAVNERRAAPVLTAPADCVNDGSVCTLRCSSLTARQHINTSDVVSCTPIKSSLKKMSPGHAKTKSVSFSADDNDDMSETATNVRRPDAVHHPSLTETVTHLDHDRVDGTAPRLALVSDSGVFCEPEDDQTPLTSDDSRATTTHLSARTTVIVSGGMTSIKNSPRHHQNEQLADLTVIKPDNQSSSSGSHTLKISSNPGSQRTGSLPKSSATPVLSSGTEIKQPTTDATTSDVRRKTSDNTQVTCSFCRLLLCQSAAKCKQAVCVGLAYSANHELRRLITFRYSGSAQKHPWLVRRGKLHNASRRIFKDEGTPEKFLVPAQAGIPDRGANRQTAGGKQDSTRHTSPVSVDFALAGTPYWGVQNRQFESPVWDTYATVKTT